MSLYSVRLERMVLQVAIIEVEAPEGTSYEEVKAMAKRRAEDGFIWQSNARQVEVVDALRLRPPDHIAVDEEELKK